MWELVRGCGRVGGGQEKGPVIVRSDGPENPAHVEVRRDETVEVFVEI